ncbi:hypothetical protein [Nonomuraea dietziae]|uniref:hypothetical protein n=1 Tax=Nonomuraea dietziae TaxID=65515 RepID=UPI0031DB95F1
MTTIVGKNILITGVNRGIGQALLEEALRRGARQVYAGRGSDVDHPGLLDLESGPRSL